METIGRILALVPALPENPAAGLQPNAWRVIAWFAVVCGACVGSFLNVCIYRIPLDQSVVRPGSHCLSCGAPIRWYHNLPVVSWFWLRGKCANCGARFSFRYAAIELFTAALFLLVFSMWPADGSSPPFGIRALCLAALEWGDPPLHPPWTILAYWLFLSGLVVGTFVDFDHFILPDSVTIGGMVAGLALSFALPEIQASVSIRPDVAGGWLRPGVWIPATHLGGLLRSGVGLAAGFGLVQAVRKTGTWWFRRRGRIGPEDEAMGFGDVKLAGALGAFLGWQGAFFALAAGAFFGALFSVPLLLAKRRTLLARIPFGPWLALGGAVWLFWGHRLVIAWLTATPPWRVALTP